MATLTSAALINAVLATFLAVGVALATWRWRRPAIVHALWLLVLLKFITPPVIELPILPPAAASPLAAIVPPKVVALPTPARWGAANAQPCLQRLPQLRQWRPCMEHRHQRHPIERTGTAVATNGSNRARGFVVWIIGTIAWFVFVALRIWCFGRMVRRHSSEMPGTPKRSEPARWATRSKPCPSSPRR